jgi:hypothetical protein
MTSLHHLPQWLAARWHTINSVHERDRGESPVSTAVIVAILAAAAVAVATAIALIATNWTATIPNATP